MRSADGILALKNNTETTLPNVSIFKNVNSFHSKPKKKGVFLVKISSDLLLLTSISITLEINFLITGHFFDIQGVAGAAIALL